MALPLRQSQFLARRREWSGLRRIQRRQRVRPGRQQRCQAVELRYWQRRIFLARGGQRGGVCRVGRRQGLRLRAKEGSEVTSPDRARGVTEPDLNEWGAKFGSPAIFVSLVEWADRIITE